MAGREDPAVHLGAKFDEPSIAKEAWEPPTNTEIGAVSLKRSLVQLDQPVPGWVRRMTDPQTGVGLLHEHVAARPRKPHHLDDDRCRFGDVHKQRTRMHEIKRRRWKARPIRRCLHDLDVPERSLGRVRAGRRNMGRIVIDANDPPPRAHALGKKLENAGRPTADINPSPALRQLDPVEQRSGHRRQRIGLTAKTLGLEPVTPKSVCRRLRLPPPPAAHGAA